MNYRITYSDELYHHGVKGMRWGFRKQRPTGNGIRRTSWSQANQMARSARQQYKIDRHRTTYSTPEQARRVKRLKVARTALIIAGSAMMGVAAYKAVRDPSVRKYAKYVKNILSGAAGSARRNAYSTRRAGGMYGMARNRGLSRSDAAKYANQYRQALNQKYIADPSRYARDRQLTRSIRRQLRG